MVQVGLSILLKLVVNFVVNILEFDFFCLYLYLNFKPYLIMSSNVINEDMLESSGSVENPIISVLISNYPLANGGYLVSFGQEGREGSFERYDPFFALDDFKSTKLFEYLTYSSVFIPKGCYYLSEKRLSGFILALSSGALVFDVSLLPASPQTQGMILVKVDEKSFSKYEQEEEDKR